MLNNASGEIGIQYAVDLRGNNWISPVRSRGNRSSTWLYLDLNRQRVTERSVFDWKIYLHSEVIRRQAVEYPQDSIVYHQGRSECPADVAGLIPTSLEKPYVGRY